MSDGAQPPGRAACVVLFILGFAAIVCGADAIVSESATTPSKHGDGIRVSGTETVLLGIGWILIGIGLISKIIAAPLGILGTRVLPVGLCALGGILWALVVV